MLNVSVTPNCNFSLSFVSWTFRNSVVFSAPMFELSKDTLPLFPFKNICRMITVKLNKIWSYFIDFFPIAAWLFLFSSCSTISLVTLMYHLSHLNKSSDWLNAGRFHFLRNLACSRVAKGYLASVPKVVTKCFAKSS